MADGKLDWIMSSGFDILGVEGLVGGTYRQNIPVHYRSRYNPAHWHRLKSCTVDIGRTEGRSVKFGMAPGAGRVMLMQTCNALFRKFCS